MLYVIYITNIAFLPKSIVKWNVGQRNQKRKKVENNLDISNIILIFVPYQLKIDTMSKKATHRLIDSVWTLEFEQVNETQVKIINYSREDKEGYEKERELPQITTVESDKGRIITHVLLREKFEAFGWVNRDNCDKVFEVINPKYVFDYKDEK